MGGGADVVGAEEAASPVWRLGYGVRVQAKGTAREGFGLAVSGAGMSSVRQPRPVRCEFWRETGETTSRAVAYETLAWHANRAVGRVAVAGPEGTRLEVEDRWEPTDNGLRLSRRVRVRGDASGGFATGLTWVFDRADSWTQAEWFAPGMIYGGFAHLSPRAIGGRAYYRPGAFTVRIREDRLPAPLFAAHFSDGTSLAVLNPHPRGDTTVADARDTRGVPLVDGRFRFGALGAQERPERLEIGYWFPGSEGEVTYAGNTYPGGQLHRWRRRFHPLRDGFEQHYTVAFRFGHEESFPAFYRRAWRWAWHALNPRITPNDLAAARRGLVEVLSSCVVTNTELGLAGLPNFIDAVSKDFARADDKAVMGFTGKCLEAAYFLLVEADVEGGARGARWRGQGEAIIASFLRLPLAPPVGEGFGLKDGRPRCAIGDREVFLRSFGDGLKALLKAYRYEQRHGRAHPEWLAWARRFADWLLAQQRADGGFPRSWQPGTGRVVSASPNASFTAVPMLVLLSQLTGDANYLAAARRAMNFCWANGQSRGRFIGGTIDNPDVLDKEAGTLSLEAYLSLYEATGEARWLPRARMAADYAETWIYLWNVPMPADEDPARLAWKPGVPTTGMQLIATGHSLVDAYMSFDVDELARLWRDTGDPHYAVVARLLLHNTKNMLALPGRVFDLGQPGWQQEHWSFAPPRGRGLHRGWLPWVATSQLNGLIGLQQFDPRLFRQWAKCPASSAP